MARVFSGSGNTQARTNLELAVAGLITMNGGTPAPALMDRIMRDVADRVSIKEILSASPTMLAQADVMVKSALGLGDPANANKLAAAKSAEADTITKTPVSLVDRMRERDQRMQTDTSNGLPNGRRSSAQFNEMKDESNPAYQDALRMSRSLPGMEWAANNRELLRLGPAAIQTLHKAEVSGKSYNRFTKEAGYKDKDAVAIVGKLHDEGMSGKDIDRKLESSADMTKTMKQHDPSSVEAFRKADKEFMLAPTELRPEMFKRVEEATRRAREANPEVQKQFDEYKKESQKLKGMEATQLNTESKATANADAKVALADSKSADADAKVAAKDAKQDFLNDEGPAAAPEPTKQAEKSVQKAEATKPAEPEKPKTPTRVASAPSGPKV